MVRLIVQFVMGFIGLIFGSYLLPSTDYPILVPLSYIIGGAVTGLTIHAIGCEGRFTGSLKNTVVATSVTCLGIYMTGAVSKRVDLKLSVRTH
jgi:hypothetical protein